MDGDRDHMASDSASLLKCQHVLCFKKRKGIVAYRLIYKYYVICVSKDALRIKAEEAFCGKCSSGRRRRVHACLHCVSFGCPKHAGQHALAQSHPLAVSLLNGVVFCFICETYIYDSEFETIAAEYNQYKQRKFGVHPDDDNFLEAYTKTLPNDHHQGMRGLLNFKGTTCFINVIVQALLHTPVIADYFLSDKHSPCLYDESLCLVCEFHRLFQQFYRDKERPIAPTHLVYLSALYMPNMFPFGNAEEALQQQDAHEYCSALLDLLHRHCTDPSDDSSFSVYEKCNCIFDQAFAGVQRSDVLCVKCKSVSTRNETFRCISLDLGLGESLKKKFLSWKRFSSFGEETFSGRSKKVSLATFSKYRTRGLLRFNRRVIFRTSNRFLTPRTLYKHRTSVNFKHKSQSNKICLLDCLERYILPSELENECKRCSRRKRRRKCFKYQQLTLKRLPLVACLHLKRNESIVIQQGTTKIQREAKIKLYVRFPEKLDLAPYTTARRFLAPRRAHAHSSKYFLFAVICHIGEVEEGHYVAYVRSATGRWYKCDDDEVSEVNLEYVLSTQAYLLFYQKILQVL